jgi:16S rRNA (adenine1518-N6/adenine1519-N6)-dimethyltransferase
VSGEVRLLGPAEVRALAAELEVHPSKRLGQNFVHDANTIRRIVRAARVERGDRVIEVGPGLGSLTLGLLEAGARVTAIEIDPRLAARLPKTVAERDPGSDGRFQVVPADALRVTPMDLALPPAAGRPLRVVANLPYNVAVPVLLHLLAEFPAIDSVLVMVQREVAERVAARPGSRQYGVPSVKAAWYGQWTVAGRIPSGVFWPEPRVESALLSLSERVDAGPRRLRELVFPVIDAAFSERRKTLRRALAGWAGSPAEAEERLREAGVDPSARAEQLNLAAFRRIAEPNPE